MTSQDLNRFAVLHMHSKKVNVERKIESWRIVCKYGKHMENVGSYSFWCVSIQVTPLLHVVIFLSCYKTRLFLGAVNDSLLVVPFSQS